MMIAACTRAMIAAGTTLLLAGCAVATVETAPGPISGTLYVAAPARSHAPLFQSPWASQCFADRFQDRPMCGLSMSFADEGSGVAGALTTLDGGQSWFVLSEPHPTSFKLRVDQHPALEAHCDGRVRYCRVPSTAGDVTLTEQFRNGRGFALQVLTIQGEFDRDLPNVGFPDALARVRLMLAKIAPGSAPAAPARHPASRSRTAPASSGAPAG